MTPFSGGEEPPRVTLPANACDCHMHVFDSAREPVASAVVTPPTATIADYKRLQARLGTTRHVLVQPSTYGTDNSLMLAALEVQRACARGVAVVDDSVSDNELRKMDEAGVVGIRFNQVQPGATSMTMLTTLASRVRELGWHIQLHLSSQQIIDYADRLLALNAPVVLDHYARVHHSTEIEDAVRADLWRLMRSGHVWLKLSAPYLSSHSNSPPYPDLAQTAGALVSDFPDRLVWGTDWPHATEASKPNDARLLDWFADVVPDVDTLNRILVDNPRNLYGFE
ncbi:amidohydrolase [Pandoraea terrae]|uniref:Amidohydrolase n=1 Tax=Pandoraea terrae TaxID=1537710 RepID=A0A5E4RD84_9BURK|nr:amidohydrolase family protein [Pandoraea terrae]VVD61336.1 amidohydrolase [Pandoraea terrae]